MMATSGESDVNTAVSKMTIKIMSDELCAKYSLKGMRGKRSFTAVSYVRKALCGMVFLFVFIVGL